MDKLLPLPDAVRTAALLFGEGASFGLLVWASVASNVLQYSLENDISPGDRKVLIGTVFASGLLALIAGFIFLWRARISAARRLELAAVRLSPFLFVGLLPFLFRWQIWATRETTFGVFVCAGGFAFHASVLASFRAGIAARGGSPVSLWSALGGLFRRWSNWTPLVVVLLGAAGYAGFFSYETILHHHSLLTTSFDLGLEDNLLWNVVHGGSFMKMSPLCGPNCTHFGNHATLFAYAIAPFYALYQRAEALLVFQAVLVGLAAVPLFLFAARHIGRWPAALVALAYLLYPPVHGANLYDFHYPPLGVFFLWLTLYLVETKHDRWAILSLALTLSVREDIAADMAVMGLYILFTSRARAGAVITGVAGVYFLIMKLAVMPRFSGGGESFLNQWEGLVGRGGHGYGAVVETVIGNPVFTLNSLLEPEKFLYLVQLAAPLCFFPWRRPIGYLLSIPGFFFTLLGTHYLPLVQISFQYTAHWTAFLFVALVANLEWIREPKYPADNEGWLRQRAWLVAVCALTVITSYQYGAIFQQHTARGGFGPYQFGQSKQAAADYARVRALISVVPPRAKISSSEMLVPQVSSRPDSYTLRQGIFDADWLLFQAPLRDDERREARSALEHDFGVVAISGDFVLAQRHHPKTDNARALKLVH
ncbi:MAG TPA: DUF2079 domain-containing protein [Polyangiaceae bacterium]|nr:DUF2079 domain-containing protein [Polyangiaceae bacterium]